MVLRGEFDNPLAMNPIMTVWQSEKATVWFAPDLANGILNVGFASTWFGIDSIPSNDVPALIDCKYSP